MADEPYIGEIRMFAGNFAPLGWMFCDGQALLIRDYFELFDQIGTTYGGDGEVTFNLPNLQCRVPVHQGTGPDGVTYQLGEAAGVEQVTLTTQQIPAHTHPLTASTNNGAQASLAGNLLANSTTITPYSGFPVDGAMAATSVNPAGGSQPHDNMQPFLCINFIISLFGVPPSP